MTYHLCGMKAMEGLGISSTFRAWVAGEPFRDSYMGTSEEEQQFGVGGRDEISFSFF